MKLKAIVVLLFFSALALTVLLFLQIPQAFIPTQDRASVFTIVEEPEGVTIEYIMEKVEQIYSSVPEVESYLTLGGFSPRGGGKVNEGSAFVQLKPWEERTEPIDTPQPKGVGILASTGESRKHGTKSRYFPRSQNRSASFFGDSPSLLRTNFIYHRAS